ncbi:MAG: hypothetical protein ACLTX3_07570 [Lachnospiraceae bacterium]
MAIRSKKLETCGLLLRLTPKVVDGQKNSRSRRPKFASGFFGQRASCMVFFSQYHARDIERLITFTWRRGEWFAVELFFDCLTCERIPFIPSGVSTENTPAE